MDNSMNIRNIELYNNLLALCQRNDAFYFVDQFIETTKYRIYLYRLASYTDFCEPDALEARGITFELDKNDNPIRIACRPFVKFFNLGEANTSSLIITNETVEYVMDKMDGSLISTYLHYAENGSVHLMLKTKGSLHSEQAKAAKELLMRPNNAELRDVLEYLALDGITVNLEYTAPDNRIVLGYEKPELTILGARYISTGDNVPLHKLKKMQNVKLAADYTDEAKAVGVDKYLSDVTGKTGVEGVVVRLINGTMVKIKADAYVALHHAKDSINTPRRLYEAVVNESADDLRSMFREDPVALMMIDEMQKKVSSLYNNMVATVEAFYQENKILGRKEYAILGQEILDRKYFSLAMMKYLGKEVDYKGFLIKSWKEFGIKDEPVNLEEAA
jgi:RNA ligase